MKVTGYSLREAIKQQQLRSDTASRAFTNSLKAFPGETKDPPQQVVDAFIKAEMAVAKLQTAQATYNLAIKVTVGSNTMTLSEAIKSVGGIARAEKMWRSAAGPKQDRYSYRNDEDEIDPSKIRSKATISATEAVEFASQTAKQAGRLRAAIATANAQEIEVEDLDATLFE